MSSPVYLTLYNMHLWNDLLLLFFLLQEIARFMQKQEIKAKRRSRELEGPASWREHRAMISHHDRRAARDRPVNVV